jgi:hypothetical protein
MRYVVVLIIAFSTYPLPFMYFFHISLIMMGISGNFSGYIPTPEVRQDGVFLGGLPRLRLDMSTTRTANIIDVEGLSRCRG